jgi:uncharacterized protein YcfJ
MRSAIVRNVLIAAALFAATVTPASAAQYELSGRVYNTLKECERARDSDHTKGQVIGGIAGAIVGTQVTHNHGLGAGVGGVGGAVVGDKLATHDTCHVIHTSSSSRAYHSANVNGSYKVGDCSNGADKLVTPTGVTMSSNPVRMCLSATGWQVTK